MRTTHDAEQLVRQKWRLLNPTLDERQRRLWAGAEAGAIGFGGVAAEAYLRDLIRVPPHWPRDRFLELCPRDWSVTRTTLEPVELERELGPLTVPLTSSEQPATR